MKKAWLNKVRLSWLPSHSLHITQPLDTYYRRETRAWASYEISSPRRKQRFVSAYKIALEKAFRQGNIRAGFRGAGIFLIDVSKALSALPLPKRLRPSNSTPITPQKRQKGDESLWNTPHRSRDVQSQLQCVDKHKITHLEQEVAVFKAQLAAKKPSGKKAVKFDPNKAFPRIKDICTARDVAEKQIINLKRLPARSEQSGRPQAKHRRGVQSVE
ncbi:hypothetical protein B0T10DRAFT_532090 [Thelonectria olida]|uniref:Uncharacterized protein n=1 Tax=Thelonectria olida TaxID=1576542 RepID=A0A9P8VY58_9HYPO|nr:hypothetical protein B0T10DRAFT_532090 [Thelonectria olida]